MLLARLGLHWTGHGFTPSGSIRSREITHWESLPGGRVRIMFDPLTIPDSITVRVEGQDGELEVLNRAEDEVTFLYVPPKLPEFHVVSHEIVVLIEGARAR